MMCVVEMMCVLENRPCAIEGASVYLRVALSEPIMSHDGPRRSSGECVYLGVALSENLLRSSR